MKKLFLFLLALLIFCTCEKQSSDNRNPEWLDELILEMEGNPYYFGSYISRYTWNGDFFYEITIPVSSCMYCDIYDIDGNRINWQENDINDYLENRKDKVLIWHDPLHYLL